MRNYITGMLKCQHFFLLHADCIFRNTVSRSGKAARGLCITGISPKKVILRTPWHTEDCLLLEKFRLGVTRFDYSFASLLRQLRQTYLSS